MVRALRAPSGAAAMGASRARRMGVTLILALCVACAACSSEATGPVQKASEATAPGQQASDPPARPDAGDVTAGQTTGAPASADPVTGADPMWVARYDFALEVDGRPSPDACFYQERDSRRLLITAPELNTACIIRQEGKQVTAVDRSKVRVESDGQLLRLAPGAENGAPSSTYAFDAASVVFYVGANRLKVLPKQPLVGAAKPEEILRHSPLYRKGMEEYTPQPQAISFLKSVSEPVEIEVFFGTWCPHCKVLVPRFMKAIEAAANPHLKVSYHGVPQGFATYDPAKAKRVTGIPTFIFWRGGREVGRIPGEPAGASIEQAVAEILSVVLK